MTTRKKDSLDYLCLYDNFNRGSLNVTSCLLLLILGSF